MSDVIAVEVNGEELPPEAAVAAPARGRESHLTEVLGIAAFFGLCVVLAARVWGAMPLGSGWAVAGAAVAGYVASDLFSGLVHWLFDTWGSPGTPVVGKTFIVPFRVHHSDPKDITLHGFVATNGHNCLAAVGPLSAALLVPAHTIWGALAISFLVALCVGVFLTNQFHKWAHDENAGPAVKWLQVRRIILSPAHHDVHHASPYDRNYCITTGWLNRPLAAIGFFRRLERVITAVTGAQPRADDLKQG
jgi:ubiquitin-conjugating enzyme E2 variant